MFVAAFSDFAPGGFLVSIASGAFALKLTFTGAAVESAVGYIVIFHFLILFIGLFLTIILFVSDMIANGQLVAVKIVVIIYSTKEIKKELLKPKIENEMGFDCCFFCFKAIPVQEAIRTFVHRLKNEPNKLI